MSWLDRRRPKKSHPWPPHDSRCLVQNWPRWDQPLRDALESLPPGGQVEVWLPPVESSGLWWDP